MMTETKRLKVFLCHAHADRAAVRALYSRLKREGVDVWLDKEKLLPGADWELEIRKAVREADVVVVCLSKQFNQAGFRQKEVRLALDTALEKPEGDIFIIPARLEECDTLESLRKWHWVDLFEENGYHSLIRALRRRAETIGATLRTRRGGGNPSSPSISNEVEAKTVQEEADEDRLQADELAKLKAAKEKADIDAAHELAFVKAKTEKVRRDFAELQRHKPLREIAETIVQVDHPLPKAERPKPNKRAVYHKRNTILVVAMIGFIAICAALVSSPWPEWLSLRAPEPTTVVLIPTATGTLTPTKVLTATRTETKTPVPSETSTALPLSTQITDPKGVTMRLVPAGEFTMGSDGGEGDERPVHQVYLDAFYMDIYEVTNAAYEACVVAGVCQRPQTVQQIFQNNFYGISKYDMFPVVYLDWEKAKTYCEWRGAKLPTEAQWEKAARGVDGRTYPWGEDIDCNHANYTSSCVGDITQVGSYESGQSPYGIYDLAGNALEWVADWYSDRYQDFTNSNPLSRLPKILSHFWWEDILQPEVFGKDAGFS